MPMYPKDGICEPASTIVEYLGGVNVISKKFGITERAVRSWRLPKSKKGLDGKIPKKWHYDIILWCIDMNIPFNINHFDDATELKNYNNNEINQMKTTDYLKYDGNNINFNDEEFQELLKIGIIKKIDEDDNKVDYVLDLKKMCDIYGYENLGFKKKDNPSYKEEVIDLCKQIIFNINNYKFNYLNGTLDNFKYKGKPVSTLKKITEEDREEFLVSHLQYIAEACSYLSNQNISMKDIKDMEYIENE